MHLRRLCELSLRCIQQHSRIAKSQVVLGLEGARLRDASLSFGPVDGLELYGAIQRTGEPSSSKALFIADEDHVATEALMAYAQGHCRAS